MKNRVLNTIITNSKNLLSGCFCFFLIMMLTACGSKDTAVPLTCPFTDIGWESSIDDIIAAEGEGYSAYDSVYGGLCYTYPKEYNGLPGTVKYMFNEENNLVSVAWACSPGNADALLKLYDEINAFITAEYGKCGYHTGSVGNYGDVWYLGSGDIILSSMNTADAVALQYAYLHPSVSNADKRDGQ